MKNETWFNAEEAVTAGLADEVILSTQKVGNDFDLSVFSYAGRDKAPVPVLDKQEAPEESPVAGIDWAPIPRCSERGFCDDRYCPAASPGDRGSDSPIRTRLTEMNANGKIGEIVKDYADARMAELGADIARQVKDETDRSVAEFLKESGGVKRLPTHNGDRSSRKSALETLARGKGAAYNMKAPGATIDNDDSAPEDFTEFLQAIWHHRNSLVNSDELDAKRDKWKKIQNSFGSVVPSDGGFLIPEELRSDLLQLALENSIIRSRATVIPMSSLAVPIPSVDETSRVSSLRGGVVAYWTEEGAAIAESQAAFGQVRLLSKKLTAYCEAPNELISDAPAFSSFLSSTLPEAIAFEEDYAFFTGSGVGEPLGVLDAGSGGTIATTRDAGGNRHRVRGHHQRVHPPAAWLLCQGGLGVLAGHGRQPAVHGQRRWHLAGVAGWRSG